VDVRLTRYPTADPVAIGVRVERRGDSKIACGRAKDQGIVSSFVFCVSVTEVVRS
jgi:hypothetical protein